ncbi:unnamed protein product, partial [Prorocentrum cordatum]
SLPGSRPFVPRSRGAPCPRRAPAPCRAARHGPRWRRSPGVRGGDRRARARVVLAGSAPQLRAGLPPGRGPCASPAGGVAAPPAAERRPTRRVRALRRSGEQARRSSSAPPRRSAARSAARRRSVVPRTGRKTGGAGPACAAWRGRTTTPQRGRRAGVAAPGPSEAVTPPPGSPRPVSPRGGGAARRLEAVPVSVRRTFVDLPVERSPSLDRFFRERRTRWGPPASRAAGASPSRSPSPRRRGASRLGAWSAPACGCRAPAAGLAATAEAGDGDRRGGWPCVALFCGIPRAESTDGSGVCSTAVGSATVALSELSTPPGSAEIPGDGRGGAPAVDPPPALGCQELPSRGSALHRWGACKPCRFHLEGCTNGVDCPPL